MVKIKAVGDICPGDKLILGKGICSLSQKYGVHFPFNLIRDALNNTDILIGNLEGILTQRVKKNRIPDLSFCGLPEFAVELSRSGFNVVNIANNHVLEHGPELFLETLSHLKNAGLHICGLRDESGGFYSKPVVVQLRKQKIGILAYNWVAKDKFPNADKYIAQSHDSVVNYTWHRNKKRDKDHRAQVNSMNKNIIDDIRKLHATVDHVILVTHWGYEFVHEPPYGVIKEAHSFIEAGANLIVGIHPHVLQGFEAHKDGWIFYSLGNFLFDMKTSACKDSAILEYTINDKQEAKASLIPIRLNNKFQPRLAQGDNKQRIKRIIKKSNEKITALDNDKQLDDDIIYKKFEGTYNKRKFFTILYHFQAIFTNPYVLKVILQKISNVIALLLMRLKGEKVRW